METKTICSSVAVTTPHTHLSEIFHPIIYIIYPFKKLIHSFFNFSSFYRFLRDFKHIGGIFHNTVMNPYWWIWIHIFIFDYIRSANNLHKLFWCMSLCLVLYHIFRYFILAWYCKYLTCLFHWINGKIIFSIFSTTYFACIIYVCNKTLLVWLIIISNKVFYSYLTSIQLIFKPCLQCSLYGLHILA